MRPTHKAVASTDAPIGPVGLRRFTTAFRYSPQAIKLVWATHPRFTLLFGALTVLSGLAPAAIAFVGKLIVDGVVHAREWPGAFSLRGVWGPIAAEALLVLTLAGSQRGLSLVQSLLRALLGQKVNVMILEKVMTLDLEHFEDATVHDKLMRAQREASLRPLNLVQKTFGFIQGGLSLTAYAGILMNFSWLSVILLVVTGLPVFIVEAKFSGEAFRLFRWRSPERRKQIYLETVVSREDYAKEVKSFGLAPRLVARYKNIFETLYKEDRKLSIRRSLWGYGIGTLGILGFYGAYVWIVRATLDGSITLGDMTMYLMIFKQGQSSVSSLLEAMGGMYEDNLYLSNLYEFLDLPTHRHSGSATEGPRPNEGVRFEGVTFTYPGTRKVAVQNISFELRPGEKLALVGANGSGKTTLIKILARLYTPVEGRVTLDGLDVREWNIDVLRARLGIIFQDFVRYQFTVGENIGAGDIRHFEDEERWHDAARRGLAAPFIEQMPQQYYTQLGRWFKDGEELSGGQWQKIALSRAFMRRSADILVLDEPTSAMDAEAEAELFSHVQEMTKSQMAILISHRFSTVRRADRIIVLHEGRIAESGTHEALMAQNGRYAHLFRLQAAGYQ